MRRLPCNTRGSRYSTPMPNTLSVTARTNKGRTNIATVGDSVVLSTVARYITSSASFSEGTILAGVHVDKETARDLMVALIEHFADEG